MLIVGLGNPGSEYEFTRHNIGFWAVDSLASFFGASWQNNSKLSSHIATTIFDGKKLILIKPTTYMNESGRAVAAVKNYYKVDINDVVVIHDELDLKIGEVRYKIGGGSAGHNGIRSIDQAIGNLYHRVRIGIDKPLHKDMVSGFVLSNFTNNEKKSVTESVTRIADNFKLFIHGDIEGFASSIREAHSDQLSNRERK
jgi:peptidyl-tRNA hydrolase, PTH1 family